MRGKNFVFVIGPQYFRLGLGFPVFINLLLDKIRSRFLAVCIFLATFLLAGVFVFPYVVPTTFSCHTSHPLISAKGCFFASYWECTTPSSFRPLIIHDRTPNSGIYSEVWERDDCAQYGTVVGVRQPSSSPGQNFVSCATVTYLYEELHFGTKQGQRLLDILAAPVRDVNTCGADNILLGDWLLKWYQNRLHGHDTQSKSADVQGLYSFLEESPVDPRVIFSVSLCFTLGLYFANSTHQRFHRNVLGVISFIVVVVSLFTTTIAASFYSTVTGMMIYYERKGLQGHDLTHEGGLHTVAPVISQASGVSDNFWSFDMAIIIMLDLTTLSIVFMLARMMYLRVNSRGRPVTFIETELADAQQYVRALVTRVSAGTGIVADTLTRNILTRVFILPVRLVKRAVYGYSARQFAQHDRAKQQASDSPPLSSVRGMFVLFHSKIMGWTRPSDVHARLGNIETRKPPFRYSTRLCMGLVTSMMATIIACHVVKELFIAFEYAVFQLLVYKYAIGEFLPIFPILGTTSEGVEEGTARTSLMLTYLTTGGGGATENDPIINSVGMVLRIWPQLLELDTSLVLPGLAILKKVVITAIIIVALIQIWLVAAILRNYRTDCLLVRSGDRSKLIAGSHLFNYSTYAREVRPRWHGIYVSPTAQRQDIERAYNRKRGRAILSEISVYVGLQIGSFILQFFLLLILFALVSSLLFVPTLRDWVVGILTSYAVLILLGPLVLINIVLEVFIRVFTVDMHNTYVTNLRAFISADFLLLFTSTLSTVVYAPVLFIAQFAYTIWTLPRADLPSFHALHRSYLAMLDSDTFYHNPILVAAVHAWHECLPPVIGRELVPEKSFGFSTLCLVREDKTQCARRRVRNRFWLWVTLYNNPALQHERGHLTLARYNDRIRRYGGTPGIDIDTHDTGGAAGQEMHTMSSPTKSKQDASHNDNAATGLLNDDQGSQV